jgi:hypothetical protein
MGIDNNKLIMTIKTVVALSITFLSHGTFLYGYVLTDTVDINKPIISVNQSGYNTGWPKRFTAPLTAEGTAFEIIEKSSGTIAFRGKVKNNIGDFSAFDPIQTNRQYQVRIVTQKGGQLMSFPFGINKFWLETNLIQPALDFMIDDRSITGTHPSAYGGAPWRDGAFYSLEVPSLVLQYLADPNWYQSAQIQMNYAADKKRVLDPGFKYIMAPEGQTALETVRRYYTELDEPVGDRVPDIIQLIHWGIGYYIVNPVTNDPSGGEEGRRLHPQTLEQFAYFLYGFPNFKKYFTKKFYNQAKTLVEQEWDNTGLYGEFTTVGSGKGRQAPGHSIMPNLMMYEVALRDGDKNADRFFQAAYDQTKWVINDLDVNDPKTTKGQRMTEHVLMPALVYFYSHYLDKAPPKLKAKIDEWVDVAISRSNNMWDFRRYDLGKNWAIPEFSETGNICALPAIAFAAASVTDDKGKKRKLEIIATGAIDDLFGRNPQNACSAYHKDMGFTNLEQGWPKPYKIDVCARLELVRGTFSSISPSSMYPYNPGGEFGHLEGWVAFNSAWNTSMAYMKWYDTRLIVVDKKASKQSHLSDKKELIHLELDTPGEGEQVKLYINDNNGFITLNQTASGSQIYQGAFQANTLKLDNSHPVIISYGEAIYKKSVQLKMHDDKISFSVGK